MFELEAKEREYLIRLLEDAHKELLRELSHTDSLAYRRHLMETIGLNESIGERMRVDVRAAVRR
jgi:hypothetical protein